MLRVVAALPLMLLDVAGAEKVKISIHHETFCPACQSYFQNVLRPVFLNPDLRQAIEVEIIASGNTKLKQDDVSMPQLSVMCQHGERECATNRMLECAKEVIPNEKRDWTFLNCATNLLVMNPRSDVNQLIDACSQARYATNIKDCESGYDGHDLELKAAKATDATGQWYTPWITDEDGDHAAMAEEDLVKYICKKATGADRPLTCGAYATEKRKRQKNRPCVRADEGGDEDRPFVPGAFEADRQPISALRKERVVMSGGSLDGEGGGGGGWKTRKWWR